MITIVVILTLAVYGIGALRIGQRWSSTFGEMPHYGPLALAVGLSLSSWLFSVGLVGRLFERFDAGLVAGLLTAIALAIYASKLPRFRWSSLPSSKLFWVSTVVIVTAYAIPAFRNNAFDEVIVNGHLQLTSQMAAGWFPPHYPFAPDVPVAYHFGFDMLSGALGRAFGFHPSLAIDLTTVFLLTVIAIAGAALVEDNVKEPLKALAPPFAVWALLLAGGLVWLVYLPIADRYPLCTAQFGVIWGDSSPCVFVNNPASVNNLYQHPQALGLPLFMLAAMVLPRLNRLKESPLVAFFAFSILVSLSYAQTVYWVLAFCGALVSSPFWWPKGERLKSIALLICFLGLALVLNLYIGAGVMTENSVMEKGLLVMKSEWRFPDLPGWQRWAWWGVNYGLLLAGFGLAGISFLKRETRRPGLVMVLSVVVGCVMALHLFSYQRSNDMVKFIGVSTFMLALLWVIAVESRLIELRLSKPCLSRELRAVAWVLLAGTNLFALGRFAGKPEDRPLTPGIRRAADFLNANGYDKSHMVYAPGPAGKYFAIGGGLSGVIRDWISFDQGIRQAILDDIDGFHRRMKKNISEADLRKYGIHYLIFIPDEIPGLNPEFQRRLQDPSKFKKLASFKSPAHRDDRVIYWNLMFPMPPEIAAL